MAPFDVICGDILWGGYHVIVFVQFGYIKFELEDRKNRRQFRFLNLKLTFLGGKH